VADLPAFQIGAQPIHAILKTDTPVPLAWTRTLALKGFIAFGATFCCLGDFPAVRPLVARGV
jgi:hypothetical protein